MNKKVIVSQLIYNNCDRKLKIKDDVKEVYFMQNDNLINQDLKNYILNDDELTKYFLISLLKQVYDNEELIKDGDNKFYKQDYDVYEWLLYEKNKELYTSLLDVFKDTLNNDMINNVVRDYNGLLYNEACNIIYTLSRLLYLQNKYKDEIIGKKIDLFIKKWLILIKQDKDLDIDVKDKATTQEEIQEYVRNTNARIFSRIIPRVNLDLKINASKVNITDIIDKDDDIKSFYEFIKDKLGNIIYNTTTYNRYTNVIINSFLNNIIQDVQLMDFEIKYYDKIKALKDKYPTYNDTDTINTIKLYELKEEKDDKLLKNALNNEYINSLYELYQDYQKTSDFKSIEQSKDDVLKWREKADKYIYRIRSLKGTLDTDMFTTDYMLEYLSYNEYQKQAYNLNTISIDTKPRKRLSSKELKEKYKDKIRLNGQELDYNRKWARLDTSKLNTNIMNLRQSIENKVSVASNMTIKKIKDLEKNPKPSKEDLKILNELRQQYKEQVKERDNLKSNIKDLYDDISLIDKQLSDTTDTKQVRSLTKKKREIKKEIKEKEETLNEDGLSFQADLLSDKLFVSEKKDKKTKERYRLMIDADYDVQNFNQEGRNFLYYIPNIPNIINQLNDDFIDLDMDDYLEFTGRPNGNLSRIRRNLQNSLKGMRKEHYDYTYIDEKGIYHDDSLVILGDIKGTEYKGKASIKVQLGATFKGNLKMALTKNQYVKVNSNVFKIGQGKNNKIENMAKEIFTYLSKLCRTEAKQQTQTGQWQKDLHLETIIKYLCEINLIKYNPNRYNESVREPLEYALNIGQELGLFTYQTEAFSYYDSVINSLNNGANVQDKIYNFENGKAYGIKFTLNNDMIDLETNHKASKTYQENKKKWKKKATN